MKGILAVLLGLPFLGVGLWLLGSLGWACLLRAQIAANWIVVPAVIEAHESIPIGARRPVWRPTVRYSYEVGGSRYESTRHDLLEAFPVVSHALGRKGRLPYDRGQRVTAHVSPSDPRKAVLRLELQYVPLLALGGLVFTLVGGAFVGGPLLAARRRAGEARDRAKGVHAPRVETSQLGLATLTAVVGLIAATTALVVTEARAWSVPAAILVAGLAAGALALARLFLRERARRRPFASCRVVLSGVGADRAWTLLDPRRRLQAPAIELALREESRVMGEDGPGPWTGSDLACTPLAATPHEVGWMGTLRFDDAQPAPVDETLRRRYWMVRVRDDGGEGVFPL